MNKENFIKLLATDLMYNTVCEMLDSESVHWHDQMKYHKSLFISDKSVYLKEQDLLIGIGQRFFVDVIEEPVHKRIIVLYE